MSKGILGNKRRVYITNADGSTHTVLAGEQSNSLSRSMNTVEVADKDQSWADFIAGKKSATAEVTVNLDNSASAAQHSLLASFHAGTNVFVFIGQLATNSRSEGDAFEAIITAINDTSDQEAVVSRSISLQVTGPVTHVPGASTSNESA